MTIKTIAAKRSAAHKFKRLVKVLRNEQTEDRFPGWKALAFERFRTGILRRYDVQAEVLDNGLVALIVDHNLTPISVLDIAQDNHFELLPLAGRETSPLFRDILNAIQKTATEISAGPQWQ